MGPSHPATHGVLRLVLEMDGEIITKATPDIGYLHRGDEKIAENMHYNQFVPYTDRLDYLAPLANNVAYAHGGGEADGLGTSAPRPGDPRDLLRAGADLLAPARARRVRDGYGRDDGVPLHLHGAGKDLQSVRADQRRALHHLLYARRRQMRDLPHDVLPAAAEVPRRVLPQLDEIDNLLSRNRIFVDRTRDIGVISRERRDRLRPYRAEPARLRHRSRSAQEASVSRITSNTISTCRSAARAIATIATSCAWRRCGKVVRILQQVIEKLPDGPINVADSKNYAAAEDDAC